MLFANRQGAGRMLGEKIAGKYRNMDVVVCGMPRGGVVVAAEVAKELGAPLTITTARKIGHPDAPEYAIAAVTETGALIENEAEVASLPTVWFEHAVQYETAEAKRRALTYLHGHTVSVTGKIAILVDDGVATGLTLRAGILGLRAQKPAKLVVAVPVIPATVAERVRKEVDDLIALDIPSDDAFLGAVGAYYGQFEQTTDDDVIKLLKKYENK